MGINVDSFFVATNNSTITANGQIASLSNPNYKLNSTIHLDMGEINKMLPDTIVQYMNGSIIANISSAGTLRPDSISEDMDQHI
jgi:predicted RNase H-related nuclease YkuK (DUF458 family)